MKHKAVILCDRLSRACLWAAVLAAMCGAGAADRTRLRVHKLKVARQDAELVVAFDIDPRDMAPGRDREVILTPVVRSLEGGDSLELAPVRIAGRNRYYAHLRDGGLPEGETMVRAEAKERLRYRAETKFEPWMEHARVVVRSAVAACCDSPVAGEDTPLAELDYSERPFTGSPFRYVALLGDEAVERSAEGRAFVDFVVNRTEIRPDYRGNRAELAKIIASIDAVKNDPDAIITRVTIKGFASPEGSYANNVRLAIGRTDALKEYVRRHYNFSSEIMAPTTSPRTGPACAPGWSGARCRTATRSSASSTRPWSPTPRTTSCAGASPRSTG